MTIRQRLTRIAILAALCAASASLFFLPVVWGQAPPGPSCDEQLTNSQFQHGQVLQQLAIERAQHQQTKAELAKMKAAHPEKPAEKK